MIAIDDYAGLAEALYGFRNRFPFFREFRLHPTELDHQTQQRRDHFFAREYQHICHGPTSRRIGGGWCRRGNLWT